MRAAVEIDRLRAGLVVEDLKMNTCAHVHRARTRTVHGPALDGARTLVQRGHRDVICHRDFQSSSLADDSSVATAPEGTVVQHTDTALIHIEEAVAIKGCGVVHQTEDAVTGLDHIKLALVVESAKLNAG
jgi:hypothetical protein